ncbi:outer membrane lipoprotein LolB [Noviherbaspirillum massiliense]|uniref:outer membrane lipoprotein LolB n=1 Tax=Noviherbaspirillum massiliense TaxID=1465823 RepID=UPI00031AB89E|nr:outer membrane lipoprotein LolB [Noviherbaspirillum massiliense]
MTSGTARLRIFSLVLPLLLAGCASLSPSGANKLPPAATAPAESRIYFGTIELGGRLSVFYQNPRTGKDEALHGSFTWEQTPDQTRVTLLSPLGQTIAIITVAAEGATLMQNGKTVSAAGDVDTLVMQTLGWPLPIAGLHEWLQGFGTDAAGQRFIATPLTPEVNTRDNWHIRYVNWENEAGPDPVRPRRIDLGRRTSEAGDVSIRIVIDTWRPH